MCCSVLAHLCSALREFCCSSICMLLLLVLLVLLRG